MNGKNLFFLTCIGFAILAFIQLIITGLALASRMEALSQVKVIEKEVEKLIPIRIKFPQEEPETLKLDQLKTESNTFLAPPPLPEPEQQKAPLLENEKSVRLIEEAKKARVAGDMATAIVKLDEAQIESPDHPVVLYELGMIHESMGVYHKASDYYEKVFLLGSSKAGILYDSAAKKIRDGFEQPSDAIGKISLGRVRIFKDQRNTIGERVILSIPVQKAPGHELDASEIEVSVTFFNKRGKGEIIQLQNESWAKASWPSLPFDWINGEELLQMDYQIPAQDPRMEHLMGQEKYYGQVVTLTYKGEVLDVQAWPRDLAARMNQTEPRDQDYPEFLEQELSGQEFDPEIPLLNPLPSE